jgi:hypothetical protein
MRVSLPSRSGVLKAPCSARPCRSMALHLLSSAKSRPEESSLMREEDSRAPKGGAHRARQGKERGGPGWRDMERRRKTKSRARCTSENVARSNPVGQGRRSEAASRRLRSASAKRGVQAARSRRPAGRAGAALERARDRNRLHRDRNRGHHLLGKTPYLRFVLGSDRAACSRIGSICARTMRMNSLLDG